MTLRVLGQAIGGLLALLLVLAGLFWWAARALEPLPAPPRGGVFERVTLVEPTGERRENVRLRIQGRRIKTVTAAATGASDPYSGAIVLPGLTDMHVHFPVTHLPGDEAYTSLLLIAHGVTTVRVPGGSSPARVERLRARIEAGALPGPRIFSCGAFVDGPDPVLPGARVVADAEQARSAVRELAADGVDCIKAYDRLDLASTAALREEAHAHGLLIIGHTPQALALEEAHLDDVQHLRGVHPPFEDERLDYPHFLRAWHRLDEARLAHVVAVSREHRMAYTPTLVAVEGTLMARDWPAWRLSETMQLWPPHLRDGFWSADVGFNPARFMTDADFAMIEGSLARMKETVARLHAEGVPLHTGSDANAPNIVPGASLHRELALLAGAGLGAEQALALSTRSSPAFLGIEKAGRLSAGAPADLVVLHADPTRDLAALGGVLAVVRDGRIYSRDDLDTRLARYSAHYARARFRSLVLTPMRAGLSALSGWLRGRAR